MKLLALHAPPTSAVSPLRGVAAAPEKSSERIVICAVASVAEPSMSPASRACFVSMVVIILGVLDMPGHPEVSVANNGRHSMRACIVS